MHVIHLLPDSSCAKKKILFLKLCEFSQFETVSPLLNLSRLNLIQNSL